MTSEETSNITHTLIHTPRPCVSSLRCSRGSINPDVCRVYSHVAFFLFFLFKPDVIIHSADQQTFFKKNVCLKKTHVSPVSFPTACGLFQPSSPSLWLIATDRGSSPFACYVTCAVHITQIACIFQRGKLKTVACNVCKIVKYLPADYTDVPSGRESGGGGTEQASC